MALHQAPDNSIHDDMDGTALDLLPPGCVEITPAYAATLLSPSMNDIKSAKWESIKAERDRRTENSGFKVGSVWFHSDQKSRSQQLGLVLLGSSIPSGLQWKTMDGTFVTMTQQLAGQILAAGAASDQAIFAIAEDHKSAMQSSADPASYDFSTGWPAAFGDPQ